MDPNAVIENRHETSLQLFCQEATLGIQTAYVVQLVDLVCPYWTQQLILITLLLRNWYVGNMSIEQICMTAAAVALAQLCPFQQYCASSFKLVNIFESALPIASLALKELSRELFGHRLLMLLFVMMRHITRLACLWLLSMSLVWGTATVAGFFMPLMYLLYNLKRFVNNPSQQPTIVCLLIKFTTRSAKFYLYMKHDVVPRVYLLLQNLERPYLERAHRALDHSERFIYRDEGSHEDFRILVLERRALFKLPRATLRTVATGDHPKFTACSYVWGNPDPCKRIIIDGKRLDLPESSFNLISHQQSFFGKKAIWIDAVCVNQGSNADKAHNIPRMQRIYAYATHVDAYLSYETRHTKLAWVFNKLWYWGWLSHNLGFTYKSLFESDRDSDGRQAWEEVIQLFELQWFCRVWILQEVAVPKHIFLNHGMIRISWDIFARILTVLERPALRPSLKKAHDAELGFVQARVMTEVRKVVQNGDSESLTDLLFICRGFRATNARDKVYAMLGLSPKNIRDSSTMKTMMPVDYGADVGVVFARAMRVIIWETGMKALLACDGIRDSKSLAGAPSWVPDWSSHDHPNWWNSSIPWRAATNVAFSRRLALMNEEALDSKHLNVELKVVDFVRQRGLLQKPFSSGSEEASVHTIQLLLSQAWNLARKHCLTHYQTEANLQEAFWRTLLSDYDFKTQDRASTLLEHDYNVFQWMLNIGGDFETSPWLRYLKDEEVFLKEEDMTRSDMEGKLERALAFREKTDVNAWRRIGFTKEGRLATFPVETQVGDEICLIAGAPALFITRRQHSDDAWDEEHRSLVGYAYVHGVMDGELARGPWQACSLI